MEIRIEHFGFGCAPPFPLDERGRFPVARRGVEVHPKQTIVRVVDSPDPWLRALHVRRRANHSGRRKPRQLSGEYCVWQPVHRPGLNAILELMRHPHLRIRAASQEAEHAATRVTVNDVVGITKRRRDSQRIYQVQRVPDRSSGRDNRTCKQPTTAQGRCGSHTTREISAINEASVRTEPVHHAAHAIDHQDGVASSKQNVGDVLQLTGPCTGPANDSGKSAVLRKAVHFSSRLRRTEQDITGGCNSQRAVRNKDVACS